MNKTPNEMKYFYNSIENLNSLNIWNIQKEIKNTLELDEEWKEKVRIERKVLNYNLNKGNLTLNSQTTDINGHIVITNFTLGEIEYLKDRVQKTNNTWLKSRYSHLIWQQTKHHKFAKIAIENYTQTINEVNPNELRELPLILSAMLLISKKTKQHIDEIKEVTTSLINKLPNWFKSNLLNSILENNIFSKDEFKKIVKEIPNWIENENPISYFTNKQTLELGIKIFTSLELNPNKLYELLAKNEDSILEQHPKDTDFVKCITLGTKAKYLKLAGKISESEVILNEYNRLKQTLELGKGSWQLGEKETDILNEYLDMKSKIILDMPTELILSFFSINEGILVDPVQNKKIVKETINESIYNDFSTITFDINLNFKNLKNSDKLNIEIIENYSLTHNIQCFSLFLKVLTEGVLNGKLNYYKIHDYLSTKTWYGTKFKKAISDNQIDQDSTWLSMLAPGIHNLFSQFELSVLMKTNKIDNFILAIDSLTLKFEGALRDFIKLSGGNTSAMKRGELKEQALDELLNNKVTQEYFTERDIELFKYTFTSKGKNLRNNVAHSFLEFSHYNLQSALLVFFCILRLGKYNTRKTT
ncbi:DUF4209 domain-containing protein [Tenacibaculum piscium]|uniref:DUF4209 domain-containing protein n=1 Tax=Tenacibaculum piscium TaxID=1458515 RepID=UPI001F2B465C|nr:DUF4209 domain-containing protein [Tenacibaculum piscium]